ncbi:sulfotransferase [Paracoccus sp. AS002]|uniref:sulfotransferase n=1 Tax=Paracoccus sp. AS002 TaxID=3019545 RepID=UPI0023E87131|nr:sulfotransferase [Paracoccus sp. AS002]MDF3904333.1 sulfotransferase [Paracoccus sp. AS002]
MNAKLYPALYAPKDGYVFVVTYGRSGSTLTQSLLNSIPGYCIRGENGNLPYFLSRAVNFVVNNDMYKWRREDLEKPFEERRPYLKKILGEPFDPWAGAESVDPVDFTYSLMNLFVEKVLKPTPGCRVSGFKEIRFHEDPRFFQTYMGILRDTFPNARFLFQTRNHDAVSKSSWWAKHPKDTVLKELQRAEAMFKSFAKENPQHSFTIEYERYSEGASYVQHIFDFLEEPHNPESTALVLGRSLKH